MHDDPTHADRTGRPDRTGRLYHPPGTIRLATPAELAAAPAAANANVTPNVFAVARSDAPATAETGTADAATVAVTPAVAPEEWNQALGSPEVVPALIEQHVQAAATLPVEQASDHLRAAVALANHLLPDDSPRKITWGTVDALRSALVVYHDSVGATFGPLGVRRHPFREMAATTEVLGSLLPPRGR